MIQTTRFHIGEMNGNITGRFVDEVLFPIHSQLKTVQVQLKMKLTFCMGLILILGNSVADSGTVNVEVS